MKSIKLTIFALCAGFSAYAGDRNPYQPYDGYWGNPREFKDAVIPIGLGVGGLAASYPIDRKLKDIFHDWPKNKRPLSARTLSAFHNAARFSFIGSTMLGTYLMGKYYTSNFDQIKNYYAYEYNRKYRK